MVSSVMSSDRHHADMLPQETTLHVFDFLDGVSLAQCTQTDVAWRKLATSERLWHRRCQSEFGIDGRKPDYTSRWKQEKHHALANLELYVSFLDEVFFSLASFFTMVSLFVVFPTLLVLKIDGWLAISWTQVFGCIYGLGFIAMMFVLVRLTLFATVFSSLSSLKNSISYCSVVQIAKCTLVNRDVAHRVGVLIAASTLIAVIPLTLQLFVEGYLPTPRLAALLVWMSVGITTLQVKHSIKNKRNAQVELMCACAFAASTFLFVKSTILPKIPWCAIMCPFTARFALTWTQLHLQQAMLKRLFGRSGPHITIQRRLSSPEATSKMTSYYQHHPPLLSLGMVALKLDGFLNNLPWIVVLIDYGAWILYGPFAQHARHLIQIMFREMPIPANLRKL